MINHASRHEQVQEGACDDDGGKHTDNDTQEQGGGKAHDDGRAKVAAKTIQHGAGDECRDV